jgi:hypothetical protein
MFIALTLKVHRDLQVLQENQECLELKVMWDFPAKQVFQGNLECPVCLEVREMLECKVQLVRRGSQAFLGHLVTRDFRVFRVSPVFLERK